MRRGIIQNLNEIVGLHKELLMDLERVVARSLYWQAPKIPAATHHNSSHKKGYSLDIIPRSRHSARCTSTDTIEVDPRTAQQVAKIFGDRLHRFWIYEEYGGRYEIMVKDVAIACKTMPQWETYQKGLEVLAESLASVDSHGNVSKKSMTVGDLLVKPIQRICKYPLLFAELLKQTPVCDSPSAHIELEKVLMRLRESTSEMNKATNDSSIKELLRKTWILQDRLVIPGSVSITLCECHINCIYCPEILISWALLRLTNSWSQ